MPVVTPKMVGKVSPAGIDKIALMLGFGPERLLPRLTAYQPFTFIDAHVERVPIALHFASLLEREGVARLFYEGTYAGGTPQRADGRQLPGVYTGMGFALDGVPIDLMEYSESVPGGTDESRRQVQTDVWLPKWDLAALRAALATDWRSVQNRAVGLISFEGGDVIETDATVSFADPVQLFSSVVHTTLKVDLPVPGAAETLCRLQRPVAAVGLQLDGRTVAMTPVFPRRTVSVGTLFRTTMETE